MVGAGTQPAAPEPFTVVLSDEAPYFSPKRLRIPRGSTVKWENRGPALVHTIVVSTAKGVLRSGSVKPGETWSYTFSETDDAVIKTACEVHPYMYGIVVIGNPPDSLLVSSEAATAAKTSETHLRILEFPLPTADSVPSIMAIDAEDNLWFTMGGGGFANINYPPQSMIGKMTLDGDMTVHHLPTPASAPDGLVIAPDGTVFITEFLGNKIARIDPRRKTTEEFTIPTPDSWPTALALDSQGNLWFNENKGNKIGRLSPTGIIREYLIPTQNARPTGMVIDAQDRVWFAQRDGNKIGCVQKDGTIIEYRIPTPRAKPTAMAVDAQGRIWFSERQGNKIAVLDNGQIREYPLPHPDSGPFFLLIDGDGQVWFTELFGDRIGSLNPATGQITEHELPTKDSWPGGLAMDSQGNLWFAMQLKNKVGVILRSARQTTNTQNAAGERR
jgi:virginiamycin B lyase